MQPIFKIAQTSVIQSSARLQPVKHQCLLFGCWVNSIGVIHSQHSLILALSMNNDKTLPDKPCPDFHPDARAVAQSPGLPVGKAKSEVSRIFIIFLHFYTIANDEVICSRGFCYHSKLLNSIDRLVGRASTSYLSLLKIVHKQTGKHSDNST